MNQTSALHPLVALAAGSLVLGTVVLAGSAGEASQQTGASAVGAPVSCGSPLPDNPKTGVNLGPQFWHAV